MLLSLMFVGSAFAAGLGLMLKELKNAPVASQDAHGFQITHKEASDSVVRTTHARIRRVRRHCAGLKGFEPAHAR